MENIIVRKATSADISLLQTDYFWLGVWEENQRAIGFYKKNGFAEFDKHIFKLVDDGQTDIMMKLRSEKY